MIGISENSCGLTCAGLRGGVSRCPDLPAPGGLACSFEHDAFSFGAKLAGVELEVAATTPEEFLMSPRFLNSTLCDDENAGRTPDRAQSVCDDKTDPAGKDGLEPALDELLGFRVDRRRRTWCCC